MGLPEFGTLFKVITYGGVACVGIAGAYQSLMTSRVKKSQFYTEAMDILQQHHALDLLLGTPVKAGFIDVFTSTNYADKTTARINVPLKGPKADGVMYFIATNSLENNKWTVQRIELKIKDKQGGRVLIFNDPNFSET